MFFFPFIPLLYSNGSATRNFPRPHLFSRPYRPQIMRPDPSKTQCSSSLELHLTHQHPHNPQGIRTHAACFETPRFCGVNPCSLESSSRTPIALFLWNPPLPDHPLFPSPCPRISPPCRTSPPIIHLDGLASRYLRSIVQTPQSTHYLHHRLLPSALTTHDILHPAEKCLGTLSKL